MTLFHALGPFASSGGVVAAPGMVLVSPTSITHSGTSATLGANGQVTFTAVTSLSLNGCFTADFDNYQIYFGPFTGTNDRSIAFRFRASGSDASGTDYARQFIAASNTTIGGNRATSQTSGSGGTYFNGRQGEVICMYGPALAQPTAYRTIHMGTSETLRIDEIAGTHSLSTSYDGVTFSVDTGTITGVLAVYGVRS